MSPDTLLDLVESWLISLRAERKSPETLRNYSRAVRYYLAWCADADADALDRHSLSAWTAALLDDGAEGTTARSRQQAVRRFTWWLADEDVVDRDPMAGLRPPKVDTKVVQPLTPTEITTLIEGCRGKTFQDRRDEAIIRFMIETGTRASETVNMIVSGTDVRAGTAVIRRGKGGKGRIVPFGPQAARALDRYLRLRRTHRDAATDSLWLGKQGPMTYAGLYKGLCTRAKHAGITGFHPHRMRNTMATRWLAAGGSEGGLMAVAGWSDRAMLARYTRATAAERAAAEARRLNLGDLSEQR